MPGIWRSRREEKMGLENKTAPERGPSVTANSQTYYKLHDLSAFCGACVRVCVSCAHASLFSQLSLRLFSLISLFALRVFFFSFLFLRIPQVSFWFQSALSWFCPSLASLIPNLS